MIGGDAAAGGVEELDGGVSEDDSAAGNTGGAAPNFSFGGATSAGADCADSDGTENVTEPESDCGFSGAGVSSPGV